MSIQRPPVGTVSRDDRVTARCVHDHSRGPRRGFAMDRSADSKRNNRRPRRSGMTATWTVMLLAASAMDRAMAQGDTKSMPFSTACAELNQTAMTHLANGQLRESELAV